MRSTRTAARRMRHMAPQGPISCQASHAFQRDLLTVRDVINQLADIEGAVYHSEARYAEERALQEVAMHYMNPGLPGVVNQIKLIGVHCGVRAGPASRCH
jgi:hypothetical protein